MALSETTLANELLNLSPTTSESDVIKALANAISAHAAEAEAITTILQSGVDLGSDAMKLAMVGISNPIDGVAAAKLGAGVRAYWAAVALGLATSFELATAIVPPLFVGLESALQAVFDANIANKRDLSSATSEIAQVIHAATKIGGQVATPPSTVTPII